ncbi:hypothetical protein [Candidatus Poriferisodalis sp.]|uniref:hypothetical protein n=1 Tax=Candidatus Poriferisodalis sp. TaxID=3101277 RepID=UPI003B01D301
MDPRIPALLRVALSSYASQYIDDKSDTFASQFLMWAVWEVLGPPGHGDDARPSDALDTYSDWFQRIRQGQLDPDVMPVVDDVSAEELIVCIELGRALADRERATTAHVDHRFEHGDGLDPQLIQRDDQLQTEYTRAQAELLEAVRKIEETTRSTDSGTPS